MLYPVLCKIHNKIVASFLGGKGIFPLTWEEEKKYLEANRIPESDIERSYLQYKCQTHSCIDKKRKVLLNIAAMIALLPTIAVLGITSFCLSKGTNRKNVITTSFLLNHHLVPTEIMEKYQPFEIMNMDQKRLDYGDIKLMLSIFLKYPLSFYFIYKCLWKIANYSYVINKFHPEIILCSAEYSFTSSILTKYCEEHGVIHCNIMHGPKLCSITNAYARFSRFYVWEETCIMTFKRVMADSDFRIWRPILPEVSIINSENKCTYYLQLHNNGELKRIKSYLDMLGIDYMVRPHPAYDYSEIYSVFDKTKIEKPQDVKILDSIRRAGMVISQFSTVLYQATLLNVLAIIDDISNPILFHELQERRYIMLFKNHRLLSDLITKERLS